MQTHESWPLKAVYQHDGGGKKRHTLAVNRSVKIVVVCMNDDIKLLGGTHV